MKTTYYTDEKNDDFSRIRIQTKELPPDHTYLSHSSPSAAAGNLLYYCLGVPAAFLYQKLVFGETIIGLDKVRACRKEGCFLYGNHTRMAGDAFTPVLAAFPKKSYILAHPDSVSLPVLGRLTEGLGCIPLPSSLRGMMHFQEAVRAHCAHGDIITVYPEAHIWPYYTKIRPFDARSFRYPAESGQPVFAMTVTYQKRLLSRKPKTTVWLDGPFRADPQKTIRENQQFLQQEVRQAMLQRSSLSTAVYIQYEKQTVPEV